MNMARAFPVTYWPCLPCTHMIFPWIIVITKSYPVNPQMIVGFDMISFSRQFHGHQSEMTSDLYCQKSPQCFGIDSWYGWICSGKHQYILHIPFLFGASVMSLRYFFGYVVPYHCVIRTPSNSHQQDDIFRCRDSNLNLQLPLGDNPEKVWFMTFPYWKGMVT